MKIAFLGTACAEPTAENGYTSFLLEVGGRLVLVDASGNPVQAILRAGRDPMSLDAVVLTHYHADHVGGFPSLLQTLGCLGRRNDLTIICSKTTEHHVRAFTDAIDIHPDDIGFGFPFCDGLDDGLLQVSLMDGMHSVPSSMVLLEDDDGKLFYTSDTEYNPSVALAAHGCRCLIHEATFSHRHLGAPGTRGHSSAYQAGQTASAAGVESLLLCHYCARKHDGTDALLEEARSAFSGDVLIPVNSVWYTV
ncbi:MAG TPA: MBL fold metallo-hydrolase [Spirochaetia bacterium]|nr:MBL fold metallo-hydrolase [Spirochaetia bacterium]